MATTSAPASPQARLTIRLAFEKLERSIAPDHAHHFKSTTLQDVRDAAAAVEDKLAASKSLRNMRRIEPFLVSLGRYAKVIEVLCNGTDYLPWIWAPIKLMLQLSSDYLSSLERLVDAYTQICDTLPRFERLSATFRDDVEFQKVLAMFYADILEFHGRCYKFFTQRGQSSPSHASVNQSWRRFFDTSWSRFGNRFKAILDSLARHSELVDKEATAAAISEAKEWREKQREDVDRLEKERLASHVSSVLSWLELGGYLNQEDELERLLDHYSPSQILKIKPDMAAFIYDQYLCKALTPSVRHLRQLLPQLLSSMQSPRIIVDGIDEYASEEQKKIIKEILTVVKDCSVNPCCKALLSSRDEPGISRSLSPKDAVSLTDESQHVNSAIEAFVDRKVEDIKDSIGGVLQLEQNFASSMKKKIVQLANGMFLWVHLVLVSLERIYSLKELEQAVDTLPKGLGEMYARTLDGMRERLASRDFDLAVRILEWVMFSRRPLKKAELLDGIALHHENTSLNTSTKLLEHVLETCKPLVEEGPNGTVVLVHFSLQE
ncbi:general transcription repressor [Neofusicoccum ribis]|uniref:General transcription repressor n=1 Tax=Neofusicoccum ribis TaxID=45134 RepID=A0ABR3SE34_9PEZI